MIDNARAHQDRDEEDSERLFASCADVPLASEDEVTTAYERVAEAGKPDAQFAAAGRYPLGSDKNVYWNQQAAMNGHPDAQLTLARIYLSDAQADQAQGWLLVARSNGSIVAAHLLDRLETYGIEAVAAEVAPP